MGGRPNTTVVASDAAKSAGDEPPTSRTANQIACKMSSSGDRLVAASTGSRGACHAFAAVKSPTANSESLIPASDTTGPAACPRPASVVPMDA